jgi:SAM-dependent methyltransferase/ribosomal protein S18 acetylase RimI-like enzyme
VESELLGKTAYAIVVLSCAPLYLIPLFVSSDVLALTSSFVASMASPASPSILADGTPYSLKVGESGETRLRVLNSMYNRGTLQFLGDNEISLEGKTVLDLGCGIGILSCDFARLVGTHGKVFAMDQSDAQLTLARQESLDRKIPSSQIEFLHTSALNLTKVLAPSSVDVIFCRLLLMHLAAGGSIADVLEQCVAVLKPQGWLICEEPLDTKCMFTEPSSEVFSNFKAACEVQARRAHADFAVGKRLPGIFAHQLRLSPIVVSTFQPLFDSNSDSLKSQLWMGITEIYGLLQDEGWSRETIDALIKDLKDFSTQDHLVGMFQSIRICGKKTTASPAMNLPHADLQLQQQQPSSSSVSSPVTPLAAGAVAAVELRVANPVMFSSDIFPLLVQIYADGITASHETENISCARIEGKQYMLQLLYRLMANDTTSRFFEIHVLGATVGFCWYYLKRQGTEFQPSGNVDRARLALIYIHPERRRQRFATAALDLVEKEIVRRHAIHEIELHVFTGNTAAVQLYKTQGWEEEATSHAATTLPTAAMTTPAATRALFIKRI